VRNIPSLRNLCPKLGRVGKKNQKNLQKNRRPDFWQSRCQPSCRHSVQSRDIVDSERCASTKIIGRSTARRMAGARRTPAGGQCRAFAPRSIGNTRRQGLGSGRHCLKVYALATSRGVRSTHRPAICKPAINLESSWPTQPRAGHPDTNRLIRRKPRTDPRSRAGAGFDAIGFCRAELGPEARTRRGFSRRRSARRHGLAGATRRTALASAIAVAGGAA
jgi:hypothetical protein